MICDCCDRNSPWARTSPDDIGRCSMCQTYQWRRDAPVRFYPEGGKPEKGHGCVRCEEPWGMGLAFVWHPECRCGVEGPLPIHEVVEVIPGKLARVRCRCGWNVSRTYKRYYDEDDYVPDDDMQIEFAVSEAQAAWRDHKWDGDRACDCSCHRQPECLPVHADRQDRIPRGHPLKCEHSPRA